MGKKKTVDMTSGNIARHLVRFALPLLFGNLFQQLYNTVDSWVVGNFVSNEAYSAVGTINPIVNLFVSFFTGLGTGCGVVVSQYFGAKREDKVSTAVHAGFFMIIALGIFMTVFGIAISPALLNFMKTPAEAFADADKYLKIYCVGLISLTVYNLCAAILRAVGDTKRPMTFLIVTAVVNIILDLLFVLKFGMGVEGVAWATVIAEFVSMVLVVITMMREKSAIKFIPGKLLSPDFSVMKRIAGIGVPAGIQMAITSFSNIFVHSYVNYFGIGMMSGYASYLKIEKFLQLPLQSMQLSVTTFVGQNIGAGNLERVRKGARAGYVMSIMISAVISATLWFTTPYISAFFNSDPVSVEYSTMMIRLIIPFFMVHILSCMLAGTLKGAGDSRNVMIIMLSSYVAFRQIYLYLMTNFVANTEVIVMVGIGAAWVVATILISIYYRRNSERIFLNAIPNR
ncbi:MAG: MATE family efflux transporter [Lachnospiraceae bacterium]|nr:MATE family efflux transporter [Lachnospiraceae bacterium]